MPDNPTVAVPIAEAATMLNLPESVIREAIHRNELPASRLGRRLRVVLLDLHVWVIESRIFSASAVPAS
jgi:excisionase family DNA binding protein